VKTAAELLSTVKKRIEAVAADDDADSLDLSGLKISENELHRSLYEQDELLSLNLSGNSLTRLPPHIAKLNSLENLDVSNNSLTHLPFEIKYLTKLKNFKLEVQKPGIELFLSTHSLLTML
jgi:Leucine-rich repeat (LRR) protein